MNSKRLLQINLTNQTFEFEELSSEVIENYIGGRALAFKLFDLNSEKNPIVLATSPFSFLELSSNYLAIVSKSELTHEVSFNFIKSSLCKNLYLLDIFAVVISGISKKSVSIEIKANRVLFNTPSKETSGLWINKEISKISALNSEYGVQGGYGIGYSFYLKNLHSLKIE